MVRKRRRKPGDLTQLRAVLWQTILEVEQLLADDCPPERVLRAGHCLAQLAGAYSKLVETIDLEQRIQQLEAAAERRDHA